MYIRTYVCPYMLFLIFHSVLCTCMYSFYFQYETSKLGSDMYRDHYCNYNQITVTIATIIM